MTRHHILVTCLVVGLGLAPTAQDEIPLPPIATPMGTLPGVEALPVRAAMPDVMVMNDGTRVTSQRQWQARRDEMRRVLSYYAVRR